MDSHRLSVATQDEIAKIHRAYHDNPNARGALAILAQRIGELPEVRRLVARFEDRKLHPPGSKPYYTLHHDHPAVYLLGWREGEFTDVHDHGACEVGLYGVQGTVQEDVYVTDRAQDNKDLRNLLEFSRTVRAGDLITCPRRYVHSVGNPFPETAATLHVYGPDLHDMRLYTEDNGDGLLHYKNTWTNSHDPQH